MHVGCSTLGCEFHARKTERRATSAVRAGHRTLKYIFVPLGDPRNCLIFNIQRRFDERANSAGRTTAHQGQEGLVSYNQGGGRVGETQEFTEGVEKAD